MDVKYHVHIEYSIPGSFIILPTSDNIDILVKFADGLIFVS